MAHQHNSAIYTVPFTLIHTGKYTTEDKLKTDNSETKHNPEKKHTTQTQQNKTTLVQSLLTTLGKETRWTYSTTLSSPHVAWFSGTNSTFSIRDFEKTQI